MKKTPPFDLVTVGHIAVDTIKSSNIRKPSPTLGGPPTYVSVAAAKLGAKVSIVSKVGDDFSNKHLKWLRKTNIDLSGLKQIRGASTTRFVLEYKNSKRRLQLEARAPSILPKDIPDLLQASAVHVAPIANEIPVEVISKLRRHTKILSIDPQGFVREFDCSGHVTLQRWRQPETLAKVDIYKSAVEEIQAATGIRNLRLAMRQIGDCSVDIVIVTKGVRGAELLFEGGLYSVPAFKSKVFVDSTGAGDAFIGAFLVEYIRGKDVLWCGSVGSAAASFVVEGLGPQRFGEKHEVYERATGIYEKVTREKT